MTTRTPLRVRAWLLPIFCVLELHALAQAPDARRTDRAVFDPAPALAQTADADLDGGTSAAEWRAFTVSFAADASGALDAHALALRVLRFDEDGDGALTAADVERALREERGRGFLRMVVRELADVDGDGACSAAESEAFLAELRASTESIVSERVASEWLERAEANPPADRNAMTAGVLLASFRAALDADADGRIEREDLDALRAALDADGDGAIAAAELAQRLSAPAAFPGGSEERWRVSDDAAARPPLMPWQRNLEDALAISRATKKPLLVCVNMDGENASEALAFGRYRDPAFVELARGFVPVLASPDRHAPRERDDRGRRIPDPRFGRLVDSEHIDVEPLLFERYFDGRRVAPRHVGVSPEGEILFDLYLLQDLSIIDAKLRELGRPSASSAVPRERSEAELLDSPDAADREELERRFVEGDELGRARLAALALSGLRPTQHPELARLALRDPSAAVRRQIAWTIAQHPGGAPLDAFPAAFAAASDEPELRAALVGALRRAGEAARAPERRERALSLLRAFAELDATSAVVEPERWRIALAAATPLVELPPDPSEFDATAEAVDALAARHVARPEDAELAARLAAVRLRFARIHIAQASDPTFVLEDAIAASRAALARDPQHARALGVHACASHLLSDFATAAEMAARALPLLVDDAGAPLALEVLRLFAAARTRSVYDALAAKQPWPAGALADARCAYEVLTLRPAAGEEQWSAYLDLLGAVEAFGEQASVLRRALASFPTSGALHAYLRAQVLRDAGARALEAAYDEPPLDRARDEHAASIDWYHGLATLVAAEQDVQNARADDALAAYRRSIERFDRAAASAPDFAPSAAHYVCLAQAGAARIETAAGRFDRALESLAAGVRAAPASAATADGLGNTPAQTARELRSALERAGESELMHQLDALLAELPDKGDLQPER